jgi:hypothetical protein
MLDFPAAPTDGQLYAAPNNVTYKWFASPGIWNTVAVGTSGFEFGIVTSKTFNYSLTVADSYKDFDNAGAVGTVVFTLPTGQPSLQYSFTKVANFPLIIDAPAGATIWLGELSSPSGGEIAASGVGSSITLKCRSVNVWTTEAFSGSWTPSA